MLKIAVVNGSVQKKNYTGFTLNIVKDELNKRDGFSVVEINLIEFNLPFPGEKIENDDSPKLK